MRDSFVFYESFADAFRELDPDTFKEVVLAVCDYAMKDEEPDVNGIAKAMFTLVKPNLDANNRRYENGKKGAEFGALGGRPKKGKKPQENPIGVTEGLEAETPNVYVDVNVNEDIKEKQVKRKAERFSAPTIEEVKEYCEERNNTVDPERFIDFYKSVGWKVGNKPMKDWRAAVRTWEKRNDQPRARSGTTKFSNFEERKYDYDALEAGLVYG